MAIRMFFSVKDAYLTNMIEENREKLDVKDNKISLNFKGFEVIMVRVKGMIK